MAAAPREEKGAAAPSVHTPERRPQQPPPLLGFSWLDTCLCADPSPLFWASAEKHRVGADPIQDLPHKVNREPVHSHVVEPVCTAVSAIDSRRHLQ